MTSAEKQKIDAHSIAAKIPQDLFFRLVDFAAQRARVLGRQVSHAEIMREALEKYLNQA